jgi:hypothetical protein
VLRGGERPRWVEAHPIVGEKPDELWREILIQTTTAGFFLSVFLSSEFFLS